VSAVDALPRPAGLGRRLGAMLYDSLIVIAIWALTLLVLVMIVYGPAEQYADAACAGHGADCQPVPLRGVTGPMVQSLLFLEVYAFFVFFWMRRGQTVGMLAWRLHIASVDGRPLTLMQLTLRFFGGLAALLSLGIGYLWMYVDPGRRTWPDLLSNTQVVYTPKPRAGSR
jgi:uncharacterized RDD family membrane protein YckC